MSVHDLYVGSTPTSVKGITGLLVDDWGGIYDVDVFRGVNKTIPGLPGETGVDLVRDAYDFAVAFHLAGTTDHALVTNIGTLRTALNSSGGTYTLTRRLPQSGSPFYNEDTCLGQFRGLVWTDTINPLDISGVMTFRNLDGAWA